MITDVITCPSLSAIIRKGSLRFTWIFSRAIKHFANQPLVPAWEANLHRFSAIFRLSANVCTQSNLHVFISKRAHREASDHGGVLSQSSNYADPYAVSSYVTHSRQDGDA